jgi:hypothetical protein
VQLRRGLEKKEKKGDSPLFLRNVVSGAGAGGQKKGTVPNGKRLDVSLGDDFVVQQRRLDFEEAVLGEKLPKPVEQFGAAPQSLVPLA